MLYKQIFRQKNPENTKYMNNRRRNQGQRRRKYVL